MQREGREVSIDYYDTADGAGVRTEWRTIATVDLDQHTANTWKAAQKSLRSKYVLVPKQSKQEKAQADAWDDLGRTLGGGAV